MNFKELTDVELEQNLTELVAKERALLCVIILHVMEIQRQRSYLQKGSTNLFSYLKELLKYSHGSAQRRIDAAMLALEIPEILHDVKSGALNLTQITAAQVGFRLAVKQHKKEVSKELKQEVLRQIKDKSVAESEVILSFLLKIKPKSKIKLKHQADGSVRIEMTLSKEQWRKLERTQELLSHSVPSGRVDELMEYVCDRVIAQKDKTVPKTQKTAGETSTPEGASQSGIPTGTAMENPKIPSGKTRKAIKISIQREVFARDRCCQHKDPLTGKHCGSRWHLQLDHIQPVWAGGADEAHNLRVLCGTHNRDRYRQQSGVHSP
jgi:hypothetical protein